MSFSQKAFLQLNWQPMVQLVRHRRINFKRPREPHYQRKLVLNVCEPYFEKTTKTIQELCLKPAFHAKKNVEKENPYQTLMAREVLNWFNSSNCSYIFHRNFMKAPEIFQARVLFNRQNLSLRYYDTGTLREAFTMDKRYNALLPIVEGSPVIIAFGSEPKIPTVLRLVKKIPDLILLCGIIDNRLLSISELMVYKLYPNLQTAQAQLVSVLDTTASELVQNITHPQMALVSHLEKHKELNENENK